MNCASCRLGANGVAESLVARRDFKRRLQEIVWCSHESSRDGFPGVAIIHKGATSWAGVHVWGTSRVPRRGARGAHTKPSKQYITRDSAVCSSNPPTSARAPRCHVSTSRLSMSLAAAGKRPSRGVPAMLQVCFARQARQPRARAPGCRAKHARFTTAIYPLGTHARTRMDWHLFSGAGAALACVWVGGREHVSTYRIKYLDTYLLLLFH